MQYSVSLVALGRPSPKLDPWGRLGHGPENRAFNPISLKAEFETWVVYKVSSRKEKNPKTTTKNKNLNKQTTTKIKERGGERRGKEKTWTGVCMAAGGLFQSSR